MLRCQTVVAHNRYRRALARSPSTLPHRERPGKTGGYFASRREAFGRPIGRDTAALIDGARLINVAGASD